MSDQQTPAPTTADFPDSQKPGVLEYRHPTTSPREWDWSKPLYPLALFTVCTLVGLIAPVQAGGSPLAWATSLGLVTAACWYVAGRVARRVDVPSGWRPLLVTAAWAAILSAAYLSARVDDPTNPLEHWEAYGTVKSELIPLLLCVTLYVLVSVCAWLVRHRREGR